MKDIHFVETYVQACLKHCIAELLRLHNILSKLTTIQLRL